MSPDPIPALTPCGHGRQFVIYGDSCSGVPGALHEKTLARVNAVIQRLAPPPEFILFPGDEIIGLTGDEATLREQWRHWFDVEMAWLDRTRTPLYHATANHTTYDEMSERVFADVMAHLPRNGPPDQQGLAYWVRDGDILLVFTHTLSTALGGEGHVETEWLAATLAEHKDARWKFVVGHHPVFPVNGYAGAYQRTIGSEHAAELWRILVENDVFAYVCSHILAFDVQCHDGVLQLLTAGAGTAHRMPEGEEYLHCVQAALDADGLRCQVIDENGRVREKFSWPPPEPRAFQSLHSGAPPWADGLDAPIVLSLSGRAASDDGGRRQTMLAAYEPETRTTPFWLGLTGRDQRLLISLQHAPGRSPAQWLGAGLSPGEAFDLEVMLHPEMGPGGFLWRAPGGRWTTLDGLSSGGLERLTWPEAIMIADDPAGGQPYRGETLALAYARL